MLYVILAMVMGIFVHDQARMVAPLPPMDIAAWRVVLIWLMPKAMFLALYWLACRRTFARLGTPRAGTALRQLDRVTAITRAIIIALYAFDLWAGWLVWLRQMMGDLVLADELLVLLPSLLFIMGLWWAYYPIDRRLRHATMINRLDQGLSVHRIWTRRQYVIAQLRHQVLLALAPMLLVMAWWETVNKTNLFPRQYRGFDLHAVITGAGTLTVMLFAPLIIRRVWDTAPLPSGEVRNRLEHLCRSYGVGVRKLLLWRTFGCMINGAVIGLIAPVRYILLTDALLEMLSPRQVEAVMAHELAHIRKHHIFWLMFMAASTTTLLVTIAALLTATIVNIGSHTTAWPHIPADARWFMESTEGQQVAAMLPAILAWWPLFGWVSRRFERQADAFAVRHLAHEQARAMGMERALVVDMGSAAALAQALQAVADLNNIPANRKSWRHGSIAWRQEYLASLVGQSADILPIDHVVLWIKIGSTAALVLIMALWLSWGAVFI